MNNLCTIQMFVEQQWQTIATVECFEPQHGWEAGTYTGYETDYALEYLDRDDAAALSWALPVSMLPIRYDTWPPFLIDLLPQGFGRQELLKHLGLRSNTQSEGDWPLLRAGAGNPIGHLRVLEAVHTLENIPSHIRMGFTRDAIITRSDDFLETLAPYGLFLTGSSGVQGVWPKLLLTEAQDGLFYLDHTLPDQSAKKHWLVKFSRGQDTQLRKIFDHEAAYMAVAQRLGLRVHGELQKEGNALFIPRFDRSVTVTGVKRHAQESLEVFCDQADFGVTISHNNICRTLAQACTNPMIEIVEYLKRDIANVAMGNKDNHTRNTAITRNWNGEVRLTPLFDFAPMWLHPDGIARVTRWDRDDGGDPHWLSVLLQIEEVTQISIALLKQYLVDWLPIFKQLPEFLQEEGMDSTIINYCRPRIEAICLQLESLAHG